MDNFIDEYLRLSERAESPTSYLKWGAISCLSSVLRDNVWFEYPHIATRVYPNTYILILGDTSVVRKSAPFNINERLLRGDKGVNNTKVMAGSATMQGVLKTLANSENGQPFGGSGIMLAKEAAGFFIQDPQTIAILTDLYDFHSVYDKHLASYEITPIKNVCLSMFAGTNEMMIQKLLDQTAKEGGFLGRCIVVKETKRRQKDSGFEEDRNYIKEDDWNSSVTFLKKLATVKGPVTFDLLARRRYNEWYHSFDFENFPTKTGYEGRIGTHVLKLSIILSAAKPTFEDRTVRVSELDRAIEECMELLAIYKQMTFGTGIAPTATFVHQVAEILMNSKCYQVTRSSILFQLHGNITGAILDEIMKDFIDANLVVEKSINGIWGWQASEKLVALWQNANWKSKKQTSG